MANENSKAQLTLFKAIDENLPDQEDAKSRTGSGSRKSSSSSIMKKLRTTFRSSLDDDSSTEKLSESLNINYIRSNNLYLIYLTHLLKLSKNRSEVGRGKKRQK